MKNLKIILLLTLAIASSSLSAKAQKKPVSKEPKTVLDFYLLLPEEYLAPLANLKNRQSIVKVKDIANGYLAFQADLQTAAFWEGWGEMALFKKTGGGYVVGVVDGSNATLHYSGIEFLEYSGGGKWRKISERIFPEIDNEMILKKYRSKVPNDTEYDLQNPPAVYFELPRRGTIVKMYADADDEGLLFEFEWNGKRFVIKK